MTDSVLYFPAIRVPRTEWLTRVLLYWDNIGTIVPFEHVDDPEFLRPFTAGLLDHGLLRAVTPDSKIWRLGAGKYVESFLDLIDRDPDIKTGVPLDQRPTVRIHTDKTGTGLADHLEKRQLARPVGGPEYARWHDVEKQTGDLLMTFLALVLAQDPEEPMDPITDSIGCLDALARLPVQPDKSLVQETEPIRRVFLEEVLPAPIDRVEPADLKEFKEQHKQSLVALRLEVEQHVMKAATIDNPRLRDNQ